MLKTLTIYNIMLEATRKEREEKAKALREKILDFPFFYFQKHSFLDLRLLKVDFHSIEFTIALQSFVKPEMADKFIFGCYPSGFVYDGFQPEIGFKKGFQKYFYRCLAIFFLDIIGSFYVPFRNSLILYSNETIDWEAVEKYITSLIYPLNVLEPRVKNNSTEFHYLLVPHSENAFDLKPVSLFFVNKREALSLMVEDARRFGDMKVNSELKKILINSLVASITKESTLKEKTTVVL